MKILLLALVLASAGAHAQSVDTATETPVAAGSPPAAVPAPAPAPPSSSSSAVDSNKKVCKLERELGSNRAKRVCRSKAEIDAATEAARAGLSEAQRGH